MIPRYARNNMSDLWSDETRFTLWLEIETLAAEAMAEYRLIPESAAQNIRKHARFNSIRIQQIEAEVKHDVIAFLTSVAEHVGEDARFLHKGMTSSDVLDTCLALQLTQASSLLLEGLERVMNALKKQAIKYKYTPVIARSHGIHAEPTSFGLKLAGHYAEMARNHKRLLTAKEEVSTCSMSGATGNFANIDPRIEIYVAQKLGLKPETVSTQIIPRDRHAAFFSALAVIASGIERLATEIRHLQRSEVREAEEFFAPGQKGSSAMPHKRNPVLSENLTGLARLIRSSLTPALENVALWHERDISHSSVERGIAPDTTIHLDFALHRLAEIVENLMLYPENMQDNIEKLGGLHCSQRVLLALTEAGSSREDAYAIIQKCAMKTWEQNGSFLAFLLKETEISKRISKAELETLFDTRYFLAHVDYLFDRIFNAE